MLKSEISSGTLGNLYVFHGAETYLRDYYTAEIKKRLISDDFADFNYHRLEGAGLTAQELRNAADALPMFSDRKLVVIRDLDLYKPGAEMKEFLEDFLSELPEYLTVIFVYDTIPYKPDARTKIHGAISRRGKTVEFSAQEHTDLISWIKRRFSSLGKGIDSKECEYLIFKCGDLMTGLINEISKIAAYSKSEFITARDIDAVGTPVLEAVIYDLTDAVSSGGFSSAFEILSKLERLRTEPIVILGALSRQMRQLYSAKLASATRGSSRELMDIWGMRSPYVADKLIRWSKGITLQRCRNAVRLCAECDVFMKSSKSGKERALELLLARMCYDDSR